MNARKSKTARIRAYLLAHPGASVNTVAAKCGVSKPMVYKLRKELAVPRSIVPDARTTDHAIDATAKVLDARATNYGNFAGNAQVSQEIKRILSRHAAATNKTFSDTQWEALEMIATKIARIVNGNPDHIDSWVDIAGYARLVADDLQNTSTEN
jgi:DNA-binding MurR/RpiR family transcriptional regulator